MRSKALRLNKEEGEGAKKGAKRRHSAVSGRSVRKAVRGVARRASVPLERTTRLLMGSGEGTARSGVAASMAQQSRDVKKAGKKFPAFQCITATLVDYLLVRCIQVPPRLVLSLGGCEADHRQAIAKAKAGGLDGEPAVSKTRIDVLVSDLGAEHRVRCVVEAQNAGFAAEANCRVRRDHERGAEASSRS